MFKRNDPAMPSFVEKEGDSDEYLNGLTKFERCAVEFTAAWILALSNSKTTNLLSDVEICVVAGMRGLQTAEQFCRQMEEREK